MPSCREGCTADLYTCTFIFVVYYEYPGLNVSLVQDVAWDEASLSSLVYLGVDENENDNRDENSTDLFYSKGS
jgi:hypothetical protein